MKQAKQECTEFLQWALPHLKLKWEGFRKVRKQVCKRVRRRYNELGLDSYLKYQEYLTVNPSEWGRFDDMCHISISRFYRDIGVFDTLKDDLLPKLAHEAKTEGGSLYCWSAGCASGEEPYALSILWHHALKPRYPDIAFKIIATDADKLLLRRADEACYSYGSIKQLPEKWLTEAFRKDGDLFCIKDQYRENIELLYQDIRKEWPPGPFQLILCRNLVATYFDEPLRTAVFKKIAERLVNGGYLILGKHEELPSIKGFQPYSSHLKIYQKG